MKIKYWGPALLVHDMDTSRSFYETTLGQEIEADHGRHIAFKAGFSIWQADFALTCIHQKDVPPPSPLGQNNFEIYFETPELDEAWQAVNDAKAEVLHEIVEQPWGQRGFRVHDPDRHIVEIAEPLHTLVQRFIAQGMTHEQIHERTHIPLEQIAEMEKM